MFSSRIPAVFSVSARATALTHQTTYPSIEKECILDRNYERQSVVWQGGLVSAHFMPASLSQVIASQTDDRFFDDHDRTLHLRSILLMILPCD